MHNANSTPYRSPTLTMENGKVVPLLITQRMGGTEVSAPFYWHSGKVPEGLWVDGMGETPELSYFEHSGGELLPRPRTTVAAIQNLCAAYNELAGVVRWVSMDLGSVGS